MPSCIPLGFVEVGEKFVIGGRGFVGAFQYQQPRQTNLSCFRLMLSWVVRKVYRKSERAVPFPGLSFE